MWQYEIEILGTGIAVTASSVTKRQVGYIQQYLNMEGYDDITQAQNELKYIGVNVNKADVFHFFKPLYTETVTVRLLDFFFEEIRRFDLKDMVLAKDVIPDFNEIHEDAFTLDDYKKEHEHFVLKVNKHTTAYPYSSVFDSKETPTIDDFTYTVETLKISNYHWTYVNRIFYKGKPLVMTTPSDEFKGEVILELF